VRTRDTVGEPVLVELQIGRLAQRTVQAFRVRTEVLLPLTQLLELAEIRFRLSPEGRLEARIDPGDRRLVIDARDAVLDYGGHHVRIEPEFLLFRDGELYAGAERLGDVFGARLVVNWADLVVTWVDPNELPIGRRVRREATRAAFLRRAELIMPELDLARERPHWEGLVFDYGLFAPSTDPIDGGAYSAALGADAWGGSLELGIASASTEAGSSTRVEGSWTGVWRDARWVKQMRVGDGVSYGPRPRAVQGVVVTNAPYLRPSYIGLNTFAGALGAGWSLEVYRGGDLVAYDSTDARGQFSVPLPVRYGENPVDFVAYGPFGEVREFNRTFRVLADVLPAGRFEYGVTAGRCRSTGCDAIAVADVRYGAAPGWTVRAGAEGWWRDSVSRRLHPYAGVIATPSTAWAVELDAVGGAFMRGGVRYEPSLQWRVTMDGALYARDSTPALFTSGRRSEWLATGFWRPSAHGLGFVDVRLDGVRTGRGTDWRARVGGSAQRGGLRVLPFVRLERHVGDQHTRSFGGLELFLLPNPALGPVLGPVWLRGGAEADRRGMTHAAMFAARQFGPGVRGEIGGTWSRGGAAPLLTIALTTYLPSIRSTTALSMPPGGPALATQSLQGSMMWNPAAGRVTFGPGPSLQRAGVTGRVFMDENANGRRDAGETAVGAVRVQVGSVSALSDSSGLYRVWDVVPFEPLLVSVDSLSLASPLIVPGFAGARLIPGPNRFRTFDIPLVRAGVIEGRVLRGGRGAGGITLVLTDRRTGMQRRMSTFSDGAFYAMGVRPGDYELTVDRRVLELLDAEADPLWFTVEVSAEGGGRTGMEIEIRRKL
jgi:hypothetical protein